MASIPAYIVDLDGTLVNVEPIRHFVEGKKKDFHSFHTASVNCKVNSLVLAEVIKHHNRGLKILVLSGRAEKYRAVSSYWLNTNKVPYDRLLLRDNLDYRPDLTVKAEMYLGLKVSYEVLGAIDDKEELARYWKDQGIPNVIKVQDGNLQLLQD